MRRAGVKCRQNVQGLLLLHCLGCLGLAKRQAQPVQSITSSTVTGPSIWQLDRVVTAGSALHGQLRVGAQRPSASLFEMRIEGEPGSGCGRSFRDERQAGCEQDGPGQTGKRSWSAAARAALGYTRVRIGGDVHGCCDRASRADREDGSRLSNGRSAGSFTRASASHGSAYGWSRQVSLPWRQTSGRKTYLASQLVNEYTHPPQHLSVCLPADWMSP